ncbi:proteoglycan 4-like [Ptychodera flava]|uniref:proteoglycan 4-like n=1 Tax=Ptychodera flava TaxID=63121 RepID=UPI00396AA7D6
MDVEPNGTEAAIQDATPATQSEISAEVSDLKPASCKDSSGGEVQDAADQNGDSAENGPAEGLGADTAGHSANGAAENGSESVVDSSEEQALAPSSDGGEVEETQKSEEQPSQAGEVEQSDEQPAPALPSDGIEVPETSVSEEQPSSNTGAVEENHEEPAPAPSSEGIEVQEPPKSPQEEAAADKPTPANDASAKEESKPQTPATPADKVKVAPSKETTKPTTDQKAKKPAKPKDPKKAADGGEKKSAPKKAVSSRLFAPTASSLRKHQDKIEFESQAKSPRTIDKDKYSSKGTRPSSASPNKTHKSTTPRSRPVSAPPANKKTPSSPRKETAADKKKPSGYGGWGPPPARKAAPQKTRPAVPSSATPRDTKPAKSGYGSFGPPPPRKTSPAKPRTSATAAKTPSETKARRPASAPISSRTDSSTKPKTTTAKRPASTTKPSSPTRPASAATRRPVTASTSSPTRPASATTRKPATTSTSSPSKAGSSTTTSRTVLTKTTRVIRDGVPVSSSTTTTVQKGSPRPQSKTTTQTRQTSGTTRPGSGTTTTKRTVTTVQKSSGSPTHTTTVRTTKHSSPSQKSTSSPPGHRPDTLNLTPTEPTKSSPLNSPTHTAAAVRNIIEHHEPGRTDKVLHRLNDFRANKQFTDLILRVKDKEIHCHRMVMAACSSYFRETLANTFSAKTDIIDIRGVQGSILEVIVDYAYSATISVPKRTVSSILEAAELFNFESLSHACQSFVTDGDAGMRGTDEQKADEKEDTPPAETVASEDATGQETETKDEQAEGPQDQPEDAEDAKQQPTPAKRLSTDNFNFHDPHHSGKVVHALNDFRPSSSFVDVVLKSAHEVLPCHRALLAACSEHFFSWFTQKTKTDQVPIPEIKPDILRKLVDFMYTSKFTVTEKELFKLFDGARKMQVSGAAHACLSVMSKHLSALTCLRILKAAESAGQTELAARAKAFALENFIAACQYDYFPHISKDRLIELTSSDDLCVPKEEMVYEAIMSWVRYDADNRKAALQDVLATVRFSQIGESFINDNVLASDTIQESDGLKEKIQEWAAAESSPRKNKGAAAEQE